MEIGIYNIIFLIAILLPKCKKERMVMKIQTLTTENNLRWLSRRELAVALRISLSSLDRGIHNNKFPFNRHIKLGSRVLFPSSILTDLEELAKSESGLTGGDA